MTATPLLAPRRWAALLAAVVTIAMVTALPARPARAADSPLPSSVTLAGSLQSELGCSGDWQPDCAATHLTRVGDTTVFSARFSLPGGAYELKVALNDSWDESYGADGGSANMPLVLGGPSTLDFTYDHATHRIGIAPTDLPGQVTAADKQLAGASLRAPLTRDRFYFLMADRFANGDKTNDAGGLTGGRMETGLDPTDKGFYHGLHQQGRRAVQGREREPLRRQGLRGDERLPAAQRRVLPVHADVPHRRRQDGEGPSLAERPHQLPQPR